MSLVSTYAPGEIKAELLGSSCQHVAGVWERDWAGDPLSEAVPAEPEANLKAQLTTTASCPGAP